MSQSPISQQPDSEKSGSSELGSQKSELQKPELQKSEPQEVVSQDETSQLTHVNASGEANMVDVSGKSDSVREARAEAYVHMSEETLNRIISGQHHKGDVFATARIAGIQAAKRTWELIPLCHPLLLSKVEVHLEVLAATHAVRIESLCKLTGKTGVEMEALTAASVAALTVYDMCKAIQKDIVIDQVRLLEKSGGKSGHFKVNS